MNAIERKELQTQARKGINALVKLSFEYIDKHVFCGTKHPDIGIGAITIQLAHKIERGWILAHNNQSPSPIQIPITVLLGIKLEKEKI